jgi:WD40 repeat protein
MASAGDDHLVRIWNRDTGELIIRLDGHVDWIRTAAFAVIVRRWSA